MNNLCATGRIGRDGETRYLGNGDPVISFPVAIDSGYGEKKITTWLNCSMFGKRGESLAPYLKKGGQVAISGEITNRPYTDKSGNEKYSLDLRVSDLTLIGGKPADDKPKQERKDDRDMVLREPGADMDEDIPF